jgi:uncharacterized protein
MHRIRLLATLLFAGALLTASVARGTTANVVVSQLYAGGGNSGAAFTNDFVELFNGGVGPVDLSGWTIQYATAAGTTWQATALSGSIQPGRYFLVQLASTAAVGAALPAPDATGTTNLAASGGKVALVNDASALACGAAAGSCSANPLVQDLVGYGTAGDYEGAGPAPALSSTTAALRAGGGCVDTNSNADDFTETAPAPRNSASAAGSCSTQPPPATSASTAAVGVNADVQPLLSIALEHPSLSFGNVVAGQTPAAISEGVTVVSNDAAGYALTVHRSAFVPADLPLGISSGSGSALVPIPIVPAADLLLGTAAAPSAGAGDRWSASVGFAAPVPPVSPGHYTATLTFTVIGR